MPTSTKIIAAMAVSLALTACSGDTGPSSTAADAASTGPNNAGGDAGGDGGGDVGDRDGGGVGSDADQMTSGPRPFPAPDAWTPNRGPGGPAASFTEEELYQPCAFLDGGEDDLDHHNLVVMWDGYLLLPWATEGLADGGLTFFDVSDPCSPEVVGHGQSKQMRETHAVGFARYEIDGEDRAFAVVDGINGILDGGIEIWEITDTSAPAPISYLSIEGFFYPDAYRNVVLSVFWQAPYIYLGMGIQGVIVVDASDPFEPVEVGRWIPEPLAQIGQVQVVGDLLLAGTAEGTRAFLLDVSDPEFPQPIPGGDYPIADEGGTPKEAYFSNVANGYHWFARKEDGGGLMAYDVRDPTNPSLAGSYNSPDGNGGYIFIKDDLAFVGESRFAAIYDISDLAAITEVTRLNLEGDLDTVTPIGNIAVLSVDDDARNGEATSMVPYATEPDSVPPRVTWSWPNDGADDLTPTSRIGVSFNEMVDPRSAWEGSVRLWEKDTDPELTRVDGWITAQENIVNFFPKSPLKRGTTYVFEIPAGGVVDYNGNAVAESFSIDVTTR